MTDTSSKPIELLDPSKARLSGAVTSLLGLLATAGALIGLFAHLYSEPKPETVAYLLLLTGLAVMGLVAGVQLLRGWWPGAQLFLLVYWLGVAVAATIMTLSVMLWRVPEGIVEQFPDSSVSSLTAWATLLGVLLMAAAAAAVVLLTMAAEPGTRKRYASVSVVSVAVAIALVVVVNVISQYDNPERDRKNYIHFSMETLGRYGLSERTKNILRNVKTPIRLTCVYTSTDEGKKAEDYRPRVLELLDDMQIYGDKIEVANVTTDSEKAKLLDRLRTELGGQAKKHEAFLKKFHADAEALEARLVAEQAKWEKHPADSYLNMWSLPVEVAHAIQTGTEKLSQADKKVNAAMTGTGLPDYANLTREVKDAAKEVSDTLGKAVALIGDVGKIAAACADPNKQAEVVKAVELCSADANAMAQNIGTVGAPEPSNPTALLTQHVALARKTMQSALAAAKKLDGLAGAEHADLLNENRFFMVSAGAVGVGLSDYYRLIAQLVGRDADEAENIVKNAKPDYQKKFIVQARLKIGQAAQSVLRAQAAAMSMVRRLATVDDASKADFELAEKGKLFGETLKTLKATVAAAEDLPELKDTSLSTDITGDNIVIVEAGGKVEVVDFDDVWRQRSREFGPQAGATKRKRDFNGDPAISSRILKMTNEPFALILLTYWDPSANMPPQMRQMSPTPPSDVPVRALGAVRRRLEAANFAVEEWNLTEDMPDPNDQKGRPKLLIVLPPPPPAQQNPYQRQPMPTPRFGDEQRDKVIDAIHDGIPAVFLTTFSPPRQMSPFMPPMQAPYGYANYLRDTWGIDVMTDYLVVPAVTDDQMPGRYKVDGQRFSYLPLSSFTDQPIGKPLQAQRVLWANLCPIGRAKDARGDPKAPPPGVTIEPVLTVPAQWKSTWATKRIQELLAQFQNDSYIWPDYPAGDLPVPFDVAVAATRAEDKGKKISPARIVVLGVGSSLMDGYLDREVAVRDNEGTISLADPPRADGDLLINSVYWLTGRQGLIASGPVQATMKEIPPGMKLALIVVYCVALPLLVLGAGGLVMLRRRR